jgi:hypothetical protein
MLDLDHPMTPYIVAAARHVDYIKRQCLYMSVEPRSERPRTLHGMESEFAALRWLNEQKFDNKATIAAMLDALQATAGKLAEREMKGPEPREIQPPPSVLPSLRRPDDDIRGCSFRSHTLLPVHTGGHRPLLRTGGPRGRLCPLRDLRQDGPLERGRSRASGCLRVPR